MKQLEKIKSDLKESMQGTEYGLYEHEIMDRLIKALEKAVEQRNLCLKLSNPKNEYETEHEFDFKLETILEGK